MTWREGGAQDRRVSVGFDEQGRPVGYSDARKGLATIVADPDPDAPIPPGTMIVISFERKRAILENQFENGNYERVLVKFEEALESEKLGNPAQIIEELRDRCADTAG